MPEMAGLDKGTPLFIQVVGRLAGEIADSGLAEGEWVPSTNELAAFYRININAATAAKGINMLADDGLLEKRRGIGMFVSAGARQRLLARRQAEFTQRYVDPMLTASGPPRDRHRRTVRPDQGSQKRAGRRLAMTPAISITGLTRRYWDQIGLDDVSFTVPGGTITGLLGRNGAGKTTLLRILADQEFPSSGSVWVLGAQPAENEDVLRRLMFVREDQLLPRHQGRSGAARRVLVLPELGLRAGVLAAG